MTTESDYFGTVLKIFEGGLNFGDILQSGGITPSSSDTYTVSHMTDHHNNQPLVMCLLANNTNVYFSFNDGMCCCESDCYCYVHRFNNLKMLSVDSLERE